MIQAAIAACHAAGGGRVVVPAGDWLTGAIHLRSNVNLHVSAGATLKFSTHPADYPTVFTRWEGMELMNYSALIYAFEQENIAVTGKGTLDGQADWDSWWVWNNKKLEPVKQKIARDRLATMAARGVPVAHRVFGDGDFLRPNFIQPYRCKNILIEDVTIVRSPMWEIHPVLSSNITVRGVNIRTDGPNNDGRRLNVPSENIVIRGCTMKDGHGGVVLGSEISGSVRNVFIENCRINSPNLDRASGSSPTPSAAAFSKTCSCATTRSARSPRLC